MPARIPGGGVEGGRSVECPLLGTTSNLFEAGRCHDNDDNVYDSTGTLGDRKMAEGGSGLVFLSHKGSDKERVRQFYDLLLDYGYTPWFDEKNMEVGRVLQRGLYEGFQESAAVVFFLTPNFRDEGYLRTEIDYALQERQSKGNDFRIITIVLPDQNGKNRAKIPEILTRFVWKTPATDLLAMHEILRGLRSGRVEGAKKSPNYQYKITSPRNGSTLRRGPVTVKGTFAGQGKHRPGLYILDGADYYPQLTPTPLPGGKWSSEAHFGGDGGEIILAVAEISSDMSLLDDYYTKVHDSFGEWLPFEVVYPADGIAFTDFVRLTIRR
jgi:hypothetical protein